MADGKEAHIIWCFVCALCYTSCRSLNFAKYQTNNEQWKWNKDANIQKCSILRFRLNRRQKRDSFKRNSHDYDVQQHQQQQLIFRHNNVAWTLFYGSRQIKWNEPSKQCGYKILKWKRRGQKSEEEGKWENERIKYQTPMNNK